MVKPLLLHIGYHKTATSWMQQRLFVREHGYQQIAYHQEVWDHLVGRHGLLFDPAEMRGVIARGMASVPDDIVPVISSEILSGHPFYGGISSDVFARCLKEIAPDARILISVRHQLRMLTSVYMQYVSRGGTMSPDLFFAGDPDLGFYGFRPEHFEYHRLIGLYQQLFGADRVYVLSQENLARDMDGASRDLARFAGNDGFQNVLPTHRAVYAPSYPEYAVPILRRINKLQKSVLTPAPVIRIGTTPKGFYRLVGAAMRRPPLKTLMGKSRPVSAYVEQHFSGRFDGSNRALLSIISQDLHWPAIGGGQGGDTAPPVRSKVAQG